MFAQLPRTTAAQAYRAYLGKDLAKGEGIVPVAGEPRDVDGANVAQGECAVCHSTLDPLAYSFSTYTGIDPIQAFLFNTIGTYDDGRTPWEGDGVIFGQRVNDLMEWIQVAIATDEFKQKIATDVWFQALDSAPKPHEQDEYQKLWQAMPQDNYSVNKLIHRFVDTVAFGGRP